jgi:mannose-1-phosphate guanylyltransferase
MRHVVAAGAWARLRRDRLVLIGATPTAPEVQYGWIERGKPRDWIEDAPVCEVARFWEKPDEDTARTCWMGGGLWNTLVLVGTAKAFMDVGWRALPVLSDRLARIEPFVDTEDELWALTQAYLLAPDANFSRAILEPCPPDLAVSELPADVMGRTGEPRTGSCRACAARDFSLHGWRASGVWHHGGVLSSTGPYPRRRDCT